MRAGLSFGDSEAKPCTLPFGLDLGASPPFHCFGLETGTRPTATFLQRGNEVGRRRSQNGAAAEPQLAYLKLQRPSKDPEISQRQFGLALLKALKQLED